MEKDKNISLTGNFDKSIKELDSNITNLINQFFGVWNKIDNSISDSSSVVANYLNTLSEIKSHLDDIQSQQVKNTLAKNVQTQKELLDAFLKTKAELDNFVQGFQKSADETIKKEITIKLNFNQFNILNNLLKILNNNQLNAKEIKISNQFQLVNENNLATVLSSAQSQAPNIPDKTELAVQSIQNVLNIMLQNHYSLAMIASSLREDVQKASNIRDIKQTQILAEVLTDLKETTFNPDEGVRNNKKIEDLKEQIDKSLKEIIDIRKNSIDYSATDSINKDCDEILRMLATMKANIDVAEQELYKKDEDRTLSTVDVYQLLHLNLINTYSQQADTIQKKIENLSKSIHESVAESLKEKHKQLDDPESFTYKQTENELQYRRISDIKNVLPKNDSLNKVITSLRMNPDKMNKLTFMSNQDFGKQVNDVRRNNAVFADKTKKFLNENVSTNLNHNQISLAEITGTAQVVGDSNLKLARTINTNTNPLMYNLFASKSEKEQLDLIKNNIEDTVKMMNRILLSYSELEEKPDSYYSLRKQKDALQDELTKINNLQNSFSELASALRLANLARKKIMGMLAGGLTFLGIGAILHPMQLLSQFIESSKQLGQSSYQVAMTDFSTGASIDRGNIHDLAFQTPDYYFGLTYGQIGMQEVPNLHRSLTRIIGGQFGNSPSQNRSDMAYFAKNMTADKNLLGISDGTIGENLKIFYRDLGMSAQEAATYLRRLESYAMMSQIPMENFLGTISGMSESLRNLGVHTKVFVNALTSMVNFHNMRIEDARNMIQETAQNANSFSSDWARNIFWGIQRAKKGEDPFKVLLRGYKSHDRNGNVIPEYYGSLVDRMFDEAKYFGTRWGGNPNNSLNTVDMYSRLLEDGYTLKQANTIVHLHQEGKLDELKEKLKGYDELNQNPMAPANTTKEYAAELKKAGSQLSEFTKIQSDLTRAINQIADKFNNELGPQLSKGLPLIEAILAKYVAGMEAIIKRIGGFLSSPIGKWYLNNFANNPIETIAGTVAAGTLARYGMKNLTKAGFNSLKGMITGKPTKSPINIGGKYGKIIAGGAILGTALLGAFVGTANANAMYDDSENDIKDKNDEQKALLVSMFQTGQASATIIGNLATNIRDNHLGKIAGILAAGGFVSIASAFIARFISKRNQGKFLSKLSKYKHRDLLEELAKPKELSKKAKKNLARYDLKKKKSKKIRTYLKKRAQWLADVKAYNERIKVNRRISKHNKKMHEIKIQKIKQMRMKAQNHLSWIRKLKIGGGVLAVAGAIIFGLDAYFNREKNQEEQEDKQSESQGDLINPQPFVQKSNQSIADYNKRVDEQNQEIQKENLANQVKEQNQNSNQDSLAKNPPTKQQTDKQQKEASRNGADSQAQSAQYAEVVKNTKQQIEAYQKEKEMEQQYLTYDKTAQDISLSNNNFVNKNASNLSNHIEGWKKTGEHEKRIWGDSYRQFLEIYGNEAKALEMAAQALASARVAGGGGGINGVPQSFVEYGTRMLQSAPPEIRQMIKNAHDKYPNVPEFVIAAIAAHESGFQNVMNGKGSGATGMMQIMPGTAAGVGYGDEDRLLHDPQYNLMAGTAYVSTLASNYDSWAKTISAYSLGGGAIDGLIKKYGNDWYRHLEEADEASGVPGQTTNYLKSLGLMDENGNLKSENASSVSISPSVSSPPGAEYSGDLGVDFSHLRWSGFVADKGWDHSYDAHANSAQYIAMDIGRLTPKAKQRLNLFTQLYAKYSGGGTLEWNVATLGHDPGTAHTTGRKIDMELGGVDVDAIIRAGNEAHVGVVNEAGTHFDILLEGTGGYEGKLLTQQFSWDDANSNGSQGGGGVIPTLNINLDAMKPKTLKEQWDASLKAYKISVGEGKTIKGRYTHNGLYLEAGKNAESYKEEDEKLRNIYSKAYDMTDGQITTSDKVKENVAFLESMYRNGHEEMMSMLQAKEKKAKQLNKLTEDLKEYIYYNDLFENVKITDSRATS